jgi:hypothetical protein
MALKWVARFQAIYQSVTYRTASSRTIPYNHG